MQNSGFLMTQLISLKVPVKLHKDLVGSEVKVQKNSDDTSKNVRFVKKAGFDSCVDVCIIS